MAGGNRQAKIISEKNLLEKIERAKQEWESTVDSLPQLICLLDQEGFIRRTNRTVEHWGLAPVVKVEGRSLHGLLHPNCSDPSCYLTTFRLQGGEKPWPTQPIEYEAKDSILNRDLRFQMRPVLPHTNRQSEQGDHFTVVIIEDVTERKQTEEMLELMEFFVLESEARYQAIVEDQTEMICRYRPDKSVTFANKAYYQYFEKEQADVIGANLMSLAPAESREAIEECIASLNRENPVATVEYWAATHGGEMRHQQWAHRAIFNEHGQIIEFQAVGRDSTEQKRAEENLILARDQALEASHLKTELLAKVSHELRTPLNAILGFAEMLEVGIYGTITGQQQKATNEIIDSTRYLTNLVNELLDQAQLEAGRLKLNLNSFPPADIVDQILSQMAVLAEAKGLTLTVDIAANMPSLLYSDAARVQQILVNLVSNAIKFTNTGSVQVHLYLPDTNHWAFQVSDTGSGIPAEAQAYIFEPFRQVDGSITRKHTGSGLGLSIVNQLTTLMGGQITLESEIGQGSTFTVILPLHLTQGETA